MPKNILGTMDLSAKNVAILVGIIYALGLIISSIHLASFGVFNQEILRVSYLIKGGLFLVFLGIVSVPCITIAQATYYKKAVWNSIVYLIAIIGLLILGAFAVIRALGSIKIWQTQSWIEAFQNPIYANLFNFVGRAIWMGVALGLCIGFLIWHLRDFKFKEHAEAKVFLRLGLGGLGVFMIFMTIIYYCNKVYPNFPQQLGGGKMIEINLKSSLARSWKQGFLIERNNFSTVFLVINELGVSEIVEIQNEKIEAIKYLDNSPFAPKQSGLTRPRVGDSSSNQPRGGTG